MTDPAADEAAVNEWATAHKISQDCVKLLIKDGFTSMDAVALLEKEDLGPKVPRGQNRLILQAVATLKKQEGPASRADGDARADGDDAGDRPDPYITTLTSRLLAQQTPLTENVVTTQQPAASGQLPSNLSWNDPQVFLRMASGKAGTATYHDISDFANLATSAVREEVVGNGTSGAQLVWRTGARKPKLSSLTIPQWSVANLAILSRLQEEGKLHGEHIMDYLSYTTRMYQLFQRYDAVSVFYYDREYRKLQAQLGFRWGTEVTHLQALWLKEGPRPANATSSNNTTGANRYTSKASDGRTVCKLYNTKGGCTFKDCRFAHVCSHVGCEQHHSYTMHDSAKN